MWQSRIAPTPSGFLHQGNTFNFLLTHELTLQHGGSLRLRVDDLDSPRVRPEYVQDIFDTLAWLGFTWQAGPANAQEQQTVYSQQLRTERYRQLTDRLIATGKVYACTCSRANLAANDPCRYKGLSYNIPNAALKIIVDETAISIQDHIAGLQTIDLANTMGDFVIRRRDGIPAYQVASLADDIDFGINAIVRGIDLIESTAAQLYLAGLLGEDGFLNTAFYHHPLLADGDGVKLSKSAGSTSLKGMREEGITVKQIMEQYGIWCDGFL